MADPTRRLNRMLDLLPRIFTLQPAGSAIGLVLRRAAEQLAQLDDAQRRVLHDRWLPLATGAAPPAGGPSALEQLGGLLDTPRLGVAEPEDDYRARLGITAGVLAGGLATPAAILSLALADLGTEPCPRMDTALARRDQPADPWVVEATFAWGLKPGARRRCAVCTGTATGPCPLRSQRLIDASLEENPATEGRRRIDAAGYWAPFTVESRSLVTDRPVLTLRPIGGARLSYPALQNRATGEITLFAGLVQPGETLTLEPAMTPAELRPFDGFGGSRHHAWMEAHPRGRAVVARADGSLRDVGDSVFFISGYRFDELDAVYAGPPPTGSVARETGISFAVLDPVVRTPLLRPGRDPWILLQFAKPESRFDDPDDPPVFAADDAVTGTRFAQWDGGVGTVDADRARVLFESLRDAEQAATPGPPVASLELEWLTRPPATFRLVILRSAQVDLAEARGAVDLLLRDLDLARPAGIRALLDIRPAPLPRDDAAPADQGVALDAALGWRDAVPVAEGALTVDAGWAAAREDQAPAEGALAWDGKFDITRLDMTRLV